MIPPFWTLAWLAHMMWGGQSSDTLGPRRILGMYGSTCVQSSAINSDFLALYLRGRYIGEDVKGRSYERLRSTNRLGVDVSWQVVYGERPDSGFMGRHNLGWHVHLGGSTLWGASFTDDAGRLALYGNAPWAGDSLVLSPLKVRALTWQEAGVGLFKWCVFPTMRLHWMASLNYVNPTQFFSGHWKDGYLITSEDGSFIKTAGHIQWHQSDPHRATYFNPRGAGFSFHMAAGIRWRSFSVEAEARDVGKIFGNIGTRHFSLDTALNFQGVYIPHVLRIDSAFISQILDSAQTAILKPWHRARWNMALPALLSLRFTGYFPGQKVGLSLQVRYRTGLFQIPETALGLTVHPHAMLAFQFSGQYGGWGRWNGGFHLALKLPGGWKAGLGTSMLDALLAPSWNSGLGGYFCLSKVWSR